MQSVFGAPWGEGPLQSGKNSDPRSSFGPNQAALLAECAPLAQRASCKASVFRL